MTYFRNNVLHLMAMPSLIACCFLNNRTMRTEDIQRLMWRIYPYARDELFLRWTEAESSAAVLEVLDDLANHGLLESAEGGAQWRRPPTGSTEAVQLSVLAQITVPIIERYYLVIAVLLKSGSGRLTQDVLESQCQLMAQRMSLLYELNSPEFFDKTLFKNFIDLLRARNVLGVNAEGRLTYTDMLPAVADDAQLVLHEQIRNSVLQVTHAKVAQPRGVIHVPSTARQVGIMRLPFDSRHAPLQSRRLLACQRAPRTQSSSCRCPTALASRRSAAARRPHDSERQRLRRSRLELPAPLHVRLETARSRRDPRLRARSQRRNRRSRPGSFCSVALQGDIPERRGGHRDTDADRSADECVDDADRARATQHRAAHGHAAATPRGRRGRSSSTSRRRSLCPSMSRCTSSSAATAG